MNVSFRPFTPAFGCNTCDAEIKTGSPESQIPVSEDRPSPGPLAEAIVRFNALTQKAASGLATDKDYAEMADLSQIISVLAGNEDKLDSHLTSPEGSWGLGSLY